MKIKRKAAILAMLLAVMFVASAGLAYAEEITKYVKEIAGQSPKSLDPDIKSLLDKLDLFNRSSRLLNNKIDYLESQI